ncbi:hypothetical protein DL991_41995 [Amycolatopsis sp. WAC 01375]|uniref:DUF3558 domain-containing protein n=1 Tax=unclassified Amycolatopsis TaxID=2618356 RepID=UPI000F770EF4|nr:MULTISPECIES: DUF3558 domain-containing protein [unclassified Amycolatopsis]RSM68319.1 hypothetical protein DL991_41995 [Amycolatopsis sp. WAC 01375]RSN36180.1 hypothetical protein DL990_08590 [Amycolatopsis sp. WAC 01416]
MLSRNSVSFVSVVVFAIVVLAGGCGPGKPDPLLKERPAPARAGDAIPVTPVEQPVDLASFRADPCGSLKREDVAALVIDPPDRVKPSRADSPLLGCAWVTRDAPQLRVQIPAVKEKSLAGLTALSASNQGTYSGWRELSIEGLPAAQYHLFGDMKSCAMVVGVSDDAALEFDYMVPDGVDSQYWGTDRCAGVLKAAELVIGNLRGR